MNEPNTKQAEKFLLSVREFMRRGADSFPVWSDPDILFVFAHHKQIDRELVITGVSGDRTQVFVRTSDFDPWGDPPIYYHGWWAAFDSLDNWSVLRKNGVREQIHAPIIQDFSQTVTTL